MLGLLIPTTPTSKTFYFQMQKTLILWVSIIDSHIITIT